MHNKNFARTAFIVTKQLHHMIELFLHGRKNFIKIFL